MSTLRDAIHNHHRKLQETLREHVDALVKRRADAREFVAFLKRELLPHARIEERHLYPAVDTLVREHGRPTATMEVDHEFIADYAERIERLNDALILENAEEQVVPEALLRQLAVELEAVVQLHLAKEERIYMPLFEQYMTSGEQRTLLDKIHESYEEEARTAKENTFDVREVTPREKHPVILGTFDKPASRFQPR
jgi:iron-sulfur cluster repair protein YtfE (RIC family)